MAVQPGPLSAVQFTSQLTVTADAAQALPAATGRRLMGYAISRATFGSAGIILLGTQILLVSTAFISAFEMKSQTNLSQWFGPNGISVEAGVSVDFTSGSFDYTLYYLDTP